MNAIRKFALTLITLLPLLGSANAQNINPGSALILYDSSGTYGWIGGLHAKMLANLLGHFPLLPYEIMPVENYRSNDVNLARATFYLGSVYDNPLPESFKQDVLNTTNRVCWFRYNLWQIGGANFEAKTGFRFNWLDWSGYSNIVYKSETLLKNQLDPELGYISVLDTNRATVFATANKADGTSIPYVTRGGNVWYVSDTPFDYISEEDRYLVFADLLHDILGINHSVSHSAIIRIEDVAPSMYDPAVLRQTADALKAQNVPFAIALVPWYRDPLGYYNGGVPEEHHMSDKADTNSVAFVSAIKYMVSKGAQLIIHGYSHQYNSVVNPYTGCSGDDFEFWRETLTNSTDPFGINAVMDIYAPIVEDSTAYILGRIKSAKAELAAVGLKEVGWEFPHYAGSATDSRVVATNFPLVMNRVLYFDDAGHVAGQFFPYPIRRDIYGQRIVPENIGNYEPVSFGAYPARSVADLLRAARKNLVVRDGWASAYFHPFFDLTNLTAIVSGIKALGYTYVPVAFDPPVIEVQPKNQMVSQGTTVTLSVRVTGATPLSYQWQLEGKNLSGGTADSFTIENVQPYDAGNYRVIAKNAYGAVTSAVAVITMSAAPVFIQQPQSHTSKIGESYTLSWWVDGPAVYLVKFGNTNNTIAVTTNSWFDIVDITADKAGNYWIVATNPFASTTSAVAILTVSTVITSQPQSLTVKVGQPATFSVTAAGMAPLTYQWQFGSANIAGATNASYTITSCTKANAGGYKVVVSSPGGKVTSTTAKLTVQ